MSSNPVTLKPMALTPRIRFKLITLSFSGHPQEPRASHRVMLWPLLLLLLWAGSLAQNGDYKLLVDTSVMVQEGLCIFVPCQAQYPASNNLVYGYWFHDKDNINSDPPVATNNPNRQVQKKVQGRFLMGSQDTHNCSLDIRDAQKGDTGMYFFRVEGSGPMKYSFRERKLSVSVTALTQTPSFQVPPTLVSGTSTQLNCSLPWACERGTPPIFSWMSSALTSLGPRTTLSSELSLTPRPQDHGTKLTCQVTFPGVGVTVERTEQLRVTYAPQKLTIKVSWGNDTETNVLYNGSSLQIQEGESLHLVCEVDSNPPAMLSWMHLPQEHLQLSTPAELHLPRVQLKDHGKYTCQAQNSLGTQVASVSLSVRSLLQLLGPSCSWEAGGLHCSCSSRAWPVPSLHWRLGEGLLEGNSSNASFTVTSSSTGPWANSSLSLRVEFSTDHRLSCDAWNDNGLQRATVLLLPSQEVTKDKAETSKGVLQGAIGGAGLMALLTVCLCLIVFTVKVLRKKSALKLAGMEGNHPAKSPVSTMNVASAIPRVSVRCPTQDPLNASGSQNQKEALATAPCTPNDEPELYYASLSFQGLRPQQPQSEESIKSEYTEIKIHRR
ncbi:sialic acid-binding Ig-like lectin 5 [Acomys russatus]|uniref:sialic acid-binding Ig-like lectin 5 n=1 Tax=Acomys russatus TaxID=60746 RepID=UPI0021E1CDDE|nr:sialic acid-binding Ig-like lectin 5 [Acomys russatus]